MKKLKALTLIEVLLVIVVIALIMIAGASQLQRYRQTRDIQMAQATIQTLGNYAVQLFSQHCPDFANGKVADNLLICPATVQQSMHSDGSSIYCDRNFKLINPFYLHSNIGGHSMAGANFMVDIFYSAQNTTNNHSFNNNSGLPLIKIQLPILRSYFGGASNTVSDLKNNARLQKIIAALQPTFVAASPSQIYYPANPSQVPDSEEKNCPVFYSDAVCFAWIINPNNWGTLATQSTNNQVINQQLINFATQYHATTTEWQKIQTDNQANNPELNCSAISAQFYQKNKKP